MIRGFQSLKEAYPEIEIFIQPDVDPIQYTLKDYTKKWSVTGITVANIRLKIGDLDLGRPTITESKERNKEIVFMENRITDAHWDIPGAEFEQNKYSFLQSVFTHLYVIMGSIGNIDEYRVINLEKALIQLM